MKNTTSKRNYAAHFKIGKFRYEWLALSLLGPKLWLSPRVGCMGGVIDHKLARMQCAKYPTAVRVTGAVVAASFVAAVFFAMVGR